MIIVKDDHQVVPLKLSQEEYEQIETLAGTNYSIPQIAMYLEIDLNDLYREMAKPDSLARFHYNRGLLVVNFEIDTKLSENARSGNITAVEILSKRMESKYIQELKSKIFNDGY